MRGEVRHPHIMASKRILRPLGALSSAAWKCPSCTRNSIALARQTQRRAIHVVPALGYDNSFQEAGVPGLLSKEGYQMAWTQYQGVLINKLNELTAGDPNENVKPKDIALMYAKDPMNASLFNHASAAHNNHHFFSTLATAPLPLEKCPDLERSLAKAFGSIDTLRATMLDTAAAMFGPGYVWLVWARNTATMVGGSRGGQWRILTTYLAGTPYPEAGYRQQGIDMATNDQNSFQDYRARQHLQPNNTAGSFGAFSSTGKDLSKLPPGGTSIVPVLCVSTWEHTYIYDYGLSGKRRYLADWWAAVDWGVVQQNAPQEATAVPARFERY